MPRGNTIASRSPVRASSSSTLSTRIAEAEQPGDLVVGLTRGVVDGAAEFDDRLAKRSHVQQVGVPAGHQQADALGQRTVVVDVGGQVTAEMVDGVEGHLPCHRICLGRSHSHQQRAGRPGPMVAATMSGLSTFAVSSARRIVGPNASR